jgi:hypothetical protein
MERGRRRREKVGVVEEDDREKSFGIDRDIFHFFFYSQNVLKALSLLKL